MAVAVPRLDERLDIGDDLVMAVERGVDLFDRRGAGLVFPIIDAVVLDPVDGREHAGEIGVTEITQRIAVRHAIPEDHDRVGTRWIDTTETGGGERSEEHTSELQSLMRISYAVFCLNKKKTRTV